MEFKRIICGKDLIRILQQDVINAEETGFLGQVRSYKIGTDSINIRYTADGSNRINPHNPRTFCPYQGSDAIAMAFNGSGLSSDEWDNVTSAFAYYLRFHKDEMLFNNFCFSSRIGSAMNAYVITFPEENEEKVMKILRPVAAQLWEDNILQDLAFYKAIFPEFCP